MEQNKLCCPELVDGKKCDYLDFVYRLNHPTNTNLDNRDRTVNVEVAIHIRVERCTGPLQLGNVVYSTTLLPGEKVRLYSQDRRSRFTFDSESQLSYRHEQSAEEQYYMDSFQKFMSDLESTDQGGSSSSSSGSASSSADTSGFFETIFSGPSVSVSGNYNAESTHDFFRELRVHSESSHNRSVQMTRETNATQVGEVQSRQHAEGESESHFESSSRTFQNNNRCHSVSYLFYQLDKQQTTRVSIKSVKTRVIDPAADSSVINRPVVADRKLSVIPAAVLATSTQATAKTAEISSIRLANVASVNPAFFKLNATQFTTPPLDSATRKQALKNVQDALIKENILDKNGHVSKEIQAELNFEFTTSIPTPGVVVRGCLDDCDICEESQHEFIKLEIENKNLQNQLLKKQIDLLENSQEYRCCPVNEAEPDTE